MNTKLLPIDKPSLPMRIAYMVCKAMLGKIVSPLKVVYARLPIAFSFWFYKISKLEKKLILDETIAMLVRHKVAEHNVCGFCIDIGIAIAMEKKKISEKFYNLNEYQTNSIYTEKERAALKFAEELTREKKVSEATFALAKRFFSEREIVEIVWLVSTEHYYNLMNLAFDIHSDDLVCMVQKK